MSRGSSILAACLALFAAGCGGSDDAAPQLSLLLVTLDTTRADAVGFLGGPAGLTPNLDALAARGFVATNARTVTPLTMPAHASILTGLYPPRHTVRDNNVEPLPPGAETLAERARERGLETAAFVASIAVDRSFGFDQGFDVYDQPARALRQVGTHATERVGEEVTAAFETWLAGRAVGAPFCAWLHYFDPHAPYKPGPAFAQRGPSPYHGEVARMDAALGRALAALEARGELDSTLIVVVGDHGEALGDDGEATHGLFVQDATMRVPLVVAFPDGAHAGRTTADPVSVVDVFPTVLAALGWGAPGDVDGRDLFGPVRDELFGVYFESWYGNLAYGFAPLIGWADHSVVYVWSSHERVFPPTRVAGPGTTPDAERARVLRRRVAAVLARPRLEPGTPADVAGIESLRGIGYLAMPRATGTWPDPFTLAERLDPFENLAEHRATQAAMARLGRGETAAAVTELRRLVDANPRNMIALERLCQALVDAARFEEALTPLRRLAQDGPAWAPVQYNLGVALFQTGDQAGGLEHLKRAVALDPGHVQSLHALVSIHEQRGEREEAARCRELLVRAGIPASDF